MHMHALGVRYDPWKARELERLAAPHISVARSVCESQPARQEIASRLARLNGTPAELAIQRAQGLLFGMDIQGTNFQASDFGPEQVVTSNVPFLCRYVLERSVRVRVNPGGAAAALSALGDSLEDELLRRAAEALVESELSGRYIIAFPVTPLGSGRFSLGLPKGAVVVVLP